MKPQVQLVLALACAPSIARPAYAAIDPPQFVGSFDGIGSWLAANVEIDVRGELWIAGADNNANPLMFRFLEDGTQLGQFALPIEGSVFAVSKDHTAFLVGAGGEIFQFNESGDVLRSFFAPVESYIRDIEEAPDGTLLLSERSPTGRGIYRISREGVPLAQWRSLDPGVRDIFPIGVDDEGTVFAGTFMQFPGESYPEPAILRFDSELRFRGAWKGYAGDLEVDGGGNIYAADGGVGGMVACYSNGGTFLTRYVWGSNAFAAMAVARDGRTYAADYSQVQTYESPVRDCVVTLDDVDGGYRVDGTVYREPMAFDWPDGSVHRIEPLARSRPADGVRVDWLGWNDGTRDVREVTADDAPTTLEVRTERRYRVDVTAVGGGSVSPPSDWYLSGTELTLTAVADEGYGLTGWTAEVGVLEPDCCQAGDPPPFWDRPDAVATIMVRGPVAQEATFQRTGFELTISASDTDPFVNSAPPANGPRKLYLWATCLERGMTALEADAVGSLERSPFAPAAGVLTVYDQDPDRLLLAVGGCPTGVAVNRLLGSWWVLDEGGDLCLGPSADNNRIGATDCVSPAVNLWPMQVTGFSSSGAPCVRGDNACATPRDRLLAGGAGEADRPGDEPASGAIAIAEPRPNPFRGRTRLAFTVVAPQPVTLTLYDVRGRRVRSYTPENYAPGTHAIDWDGRDEGGKTVPAGIYFARFDGPQAGTARKIVYLGR